MFLHSLSPVVLSWLHTEKIGVYFIVKKIIKQSFNHILSNFLAPGTTFKNDHHNPLDQKKNKNLEIIIK